MAPGGFAQGDPEKRRYGVQLVKVATKCWRFTKAMEQDGRLLLRQSRRHHRSQTPHSGLGNRGQNYCLPIPLKDECFVYQDIRDKGLFLEASWYELCTESVGRAQGYHVRPIPWHNLALGMMMLTNNALQHEQMCCDCSSRHNGRYRSPHCDTAFRTGR